MWTRPVQNKESLTRWLNLISPRAAPLRFASLKESFLSNQGCSPFGLADVEVQVEKIHPA